MERINKSFHVEFEILRLKNGREELHANFQKEPGYELKPGTYIIKKQFIVIKILGFLNCRNKINTFTNSTSVSNNHNLLLLKEFIKLMRNKP